MTVVPDIAGDISNPTQAVEDTAQDDDESKNEIAETENLIAEIADKLTSKKALRQKNLEAPREYIENSVICPKRIENFQTNEF